MSNFKHIKFTQRVKPIHELCYTPDAKLYTFYQICQFKNPFTGKYDTRKIIFNEQCEIKKTYERQYKSHELEKFLKNCPQNKYKMYPVKEITCVSLPNSSNMLEVHSSLINNECQTYDYQCW